MEMAVKNRQTVKRLKDDETIKGLGFDGPLFICGNHGG